ncbi:glycine betaine/proline transport system ATP-binding protein [Sulfitobacter brevis]|uniref:Quaternary amine transport ATP-binding protein n=1 Tax=Sulfitobacter brevis TaxID=74348 RepID=A0A1I1WKE7_9RHOB|nr:betaine/proline/choline family ABC transporter ATP-binding protein [Sulfitobacter brevis]SFD95606.1 glycine betaine/proline transport system ATP-binding protein [Sulfitobacter brevis]
MTDTEIKISIRSLYKVFGDDPLPALQYVKGGLSKADLLETHNHVLGLNDINVDVPAGKTTVIMGLSGSGKSTLIRHLNRLIEPTAGEVLVNGDNILDYSEAQLRELRKHTMSMVFQKFALLPHRTVLQNAGLAPSVGGQKERQYADEARKWLDRVGLQGQGEQYPHQMSGGMQQRVGIARALTSNSDIMLMDEAFSALDPLIRTDMQGLLIELQAELQKTVVFITHDLDEALKLADHLVILKDGSVVQQGEPQYILLNPATPYIKDFVSDINRARVLRVRSVMTKAPDATGERAGEIDHDDTLESVIALSEGDTSLSYRVMKDGKLVGVLDMRKLVRALVPVEQSDDPENARLSG